MDFRSLKVKKRAVVYLSLGWVVLTHPQCRPKLVADLLDVDPVMNMSGKRICRLRNLAVRTNGQPRLIDI